MEGERIAKSLGIYQEKYKALLLRQRKEEGEAAVEAAKEPPKEQDRKKSSVDVVRKVSPFFSHRCSG